MRHVGLVAFALFVAGAVYCALLVYEVGLRPKLLLPSYGDVPAFDLTDTTGKPVHRDDLLGRVTIVDFIFTSCSSACPLLTGKMAHLQADARDVQLLSISVDPERDTPERLAAYAQHSGADPKRWRFVRGDDTHLRRVVVDGMKQEIAKEPDQGETDGFTILHGTRFVLVDQQARIRGFYDANDEGSMLALRGAMTALLEGRATER